MRQLLRRPMGAAVLHRLGIKAEVLAPNPNWQYGIMLAALNLRDASCGSSSKSSSSSSMCDADTGTNADANADAARKEDACWLAALPQLQPDHGLRSRVWNTSSGFISGQCSPHVESLQRTCWRQQAKKTPA
eukprot:4869295-Pleurochrysis_carterae.AAC.5